MKFTARPPKKGQQIEPAEQTAKARVNTGQCAIYKTMAKPTTIVDKNWLQRICEQPDANHVIPSKLKEVCVPVVSVVLIEEVMANYFQADPDRAVTLRLIQAILDFHPHWMEEPSELAFRELVRCERITDLGMPLSKSKAFAEALQNPDEGSFDLKSWMQKRFNEMTERRDARTALKVKFLRFAPEQLLHAPTLGSFAKNGGSLLECIFQRNETKELAVS